MRIRHVMIASLTVALWACPGQPALATVASDMEADLRASGISDVTVQVQTPPAAPSALNEDADWSGVTLDSLTPFMSSDPFQPSPVARITVDRDPGSPLKGIVEPPGEATYTMAVAELPKLKLAVWEALKHALAQGANLAGTRLDLREDGAVVSSELTSAPQPGAYSPTQDSPSVMSKDAVRQQVEGDFPAWAKAAQVTVSDDYVGERIVMAQLDLPHASFASIDVGELLRTLISMQIRLQDQGARIGRVLARVDDPITGDPLYTAAADALFGSMELTWYSPHVRGIARGLVGPDVRSLVPPVNSGQLPAAP